MIHFFTGILNQISSKEFDKMRFIVDLSQQDVQTANRQETAANEKIEKQKKKERKTETETGKNRGTTDDDQCVSQFARVGLCTSAPYPQK